MQNVQADEVQGNIEQNDVSIVPGLKTIGYTFRMRYTEDYWSPNHMYSTHLPPKGDYKEVRTLVDREVSEKIIALKDARIAELEALVNKFMAENINENLEPLTDLSAAKKIIKARDLVIELQANSIAKLERDNWALKDENDKKENRKEVISNALNKMVSLYQSEHDEGPFKRPDWLENALAYQYDGFPINSGIDPEHEQVVNHAAQIAEGNSMSFDHQKALKEENDYDSGYHRGRVAAATDIRDNLSKI